MSIVSSSFDDDIASIDGNPITTNYINIRQLNPFSNKDYLRPNKNSLDQISIMLNCQVDEKITEDTLIYRNRYLMDDAELTSIQEKTNLGNLLVIDISNNFLKNIPMMLLLNTSKLIALNLSRNKVKAFPQNFLSHFPNLVYFNLASNWIFAISNDFFQIQKTTTQLKHLDMSSNALKILPETFENLVSLEFLALDSTNITLIPVKLINLVKLKTLRLSWMQYLEPSYADTSFTATSTIPLTELYKLLQQIEKKGDSAISFTAFINYYSKQKLSYVIKDNYGRNILHNAVLKDDLGPSRIIGENYSFLLNEIDFEGLTPFIFALREKKLLFVDIFLSLGANINCGAGKFGSALHIAVLHLKIKLINSLIQKGASLNAIDINGNTVLHILFMNFTKNRQKSIKIAEILLSKDAPINIKNNDGVTPLQIAVQKHYSTTIGFCLTYNTKAKLQHYSKNRLFDASVQDKNNNTLLHMAASFPNIQIIIGLDDYEINPFHENYQGKTANTITPQEFLTSRKVLHKMERAWVNKYFFEKNNGESISQAMQNYNNPKSIPIKKFIAPNHIHNIEKFTCPQKRKYNLDDEANIKYEEEKTIPALPKTMSPFKFKNEKKRNKFKSHFGNHLIMAESNLSLKSHNFDSDNISEVAGEFQPVYHHECNSFGILKKTVIGYLIKCHELKIERNSMSEKFFELWAQRNSLSVVEKQILNQLLFELIGLVQIRHRIFKTISFYLNKYESIPGCKINLTSEFDELLVKDSLANDLKLLNQIYQKSKSYEEINPSIRYLELKILDYFNDINFYNSIKIIKKDIKKNFIKKLRLMSALSIFMNSFLNLSHNCIGIKYCLKYFCGEDESSINHGTSFDKGNFSQNPKMGNDNKDFEQMDEEMYEDDELLVQTKNQFFLAKCPAKMQTNLNRIKRIYLVFPMMAIQQLQPIILQSKYIYFFKIFQKIFSTI